MTYTILRSPRPGWTNPGNPLGPSPLRLIGYGPRTHDELRGLRVGPSGPAWADAPLAPRVARPCYPVSWSCEPCAPSSRRYRIQFVEGGPVVERAWWEVVAPDDDHRTRVAKLRRFQQVDAAQDAVTAAQRLLLSLTR